MRIVHASHSFAPGLEISDVQTLPYLLIYSSILFSCSCRRRILFIIYLYYYLLFFILIAATNRYHLLPTFFFYYFFLTLGTDFPPALRLASGDRERLKWPSKIEYQPVRYAVHHVG